MVAVHERLHDLQVWMIAGSAHELLCLVGRKRDWFFAQHVFAGFEGPNGERHVQVIGQWDVHRINVRIGEQRFVRAEGLVDSKGCGHRLGLGQIARGDGGHFQVFAVRGLEHRGNDGLAGDRRRTQNSPADFFHDARLERGRYNRSLRVACLSRSRSIVVPCRVGRV